MTNKINRITRRARQVIVLAMETQQRMKHSVLDSDHLLIGLIRENGCIAARVLSDMGLSFSELDKVEMVCHTYHQNDAPSGRKIEFSEDTKQILETAVDEARQLHDPYIGTQHVLLAITRIESCYATTLLSSFQIPPDALREKIYEELQQITPLYKRLQSIAFRIQYTFEYVQSLLADLWTKLMKMMGKKRNVERFTGSARRVLTHAENSAKSLKHPIMDTDHMLIGLMQETGGVAAQALSELGLPISKIDEVIEICRTNSKFDMPESDQLLLGDGTKAFLFQAVEEARGLGHHYIGTEHLLLALSALGHTHATVILNHYQITPEMIRQKTFEILNRRPETAENSQDDEGSEE